MAARDRGEEEIFRIMTGCFASKRRIRTSVQVRFSDNLYVILAAVAGVAPLLSRRGRAIPDEARRELVLVAHLVFGLSSEIVSLKPSGSVTMRAFGPHGSGAT